MQNLSSTKMLRSNREAVLRETNIYSQCYIKDVRVLSCHLAETFRIINLPMEANASASVTFAIFSEQFKFAHGSKYIVFLVIKFQSSYIYPTFTSIATPE